MFAQRCVDGADGRCFGHSPGVGQCNAVITLKGLGHRRRQRGAADQRTFKFRQPDLCPCASPPASRPRSPGTHKPHRHLLGGQQLQQAVAIEVRPRQHQPRADHGGDKRRPHALTWNIGTTGNRLSFADMPAASGWLPLRACRTSERWVFNHPLSAGRWFPRCNRAKPESVH